MDRENQPIRILFVEDLPADVEMARREISKGKIDFTYKVTDTEPGFRNLLDEFEPEVVVSDYSMPSFDGMTALKISLEKKPHTPFIVLTGSMNEETAVACMKAGATDYVIKEKIKRLPFAVKEAIKKSRSWEEKEKMQKQLRENEEMYHSLIENSGDAIYLLVNRKFEIINSGFENMFGYKLEEISKTDFDFINLVAPEDRKFIEERYQKVQNGENLDKLYEFTALTKEGKKLSVEASNSYLDFKGAKAVQGIIRDVSERKKMVEELVKAKERAEESDRLKSAFLANMSHEIRTPMNGILGFTDLLKEPRLSGEEKNQFVDIIQESGQRMLNTINDLIEISKIESGTMKLDYSNVEINSTIDFFYIFFKPEVEKKGLEFSNKKATPGESATIKTDKEKLHAIFTNLIKNAVKYTSSGSIEFGYRIKDSGVEFFVKDTGVGIAPDRHDAIFNRFVQADNSSTKPYEGAGLGLAIAKAYVEMLGGNIKVDSEPGKGSDFIFFIPHPEQTTSEQNTNHQSINYPQIHKKLKKLNILIAEDDDVARLFLIELLDGKCKHLWLASNGEEAVELYDKNSDTDLVLMDMKMPVMDGYIATKKIKEKNPNARIIAQTAYALRGDSDKAIAAGCDDYLTKPLKKVELLKLIDKYF